MKRPFDSESSVAAAIAIVGAVRTKTLLIPVPSRIREVCTAQAASTANWSPAMPLGDPGRVVAERLGELYQFDDLGRVGTAGYRDADPVHPTPALRPRRRQF